MSTASPSSVGNYILCGELAKGGMATIWIGHAAGSTLPLAIKKLHAHASSPELLTMFLDELALSRRVRHKNVVETIEVVSTDEDLCLVMEYIEGETLSRLLRACREQGLSMPVPIAARILIGALTGLHAVHEATDDRGRPLHVVHRDVSPQNIMVGVDGIPRVLDLGVAKAAVRLQQTRTGELKGKIAYMAPEQLESHDVSRLTDIYAMGIVAWESLVGRRMFEAETEGQLVARVLKGVKEPPSASAPGGRGHVSEALDAVVLKALSRTPGDRFPTARHFAGAIELATPVATGAEVASFVQTVAKKSLEAREKRVTRMLQQGSAEGLGPPSAPSISAAPPSSASSISSSLSAGTGGLRSQVRAPAPSVPTIDEATSIDLTSVMSGKTAVKPPGKHVLVIDDSEVILENARRVLEAEGYKVTTTTQTVGAARHLVDCDLALIDFHMPGLNGADVINSLRAAAKAHGRACLFYLFTSDPEAAKKYREIGFDGSLTGKGDDDSLLRGVRAAFRVLHLRAMANKSTRT